MDSKPMRWAELRERVSSLVHLLNHETPSMAFQKAFVLSRGLLTDIDAAAPAMERQEQRALCWSVWKDLASSDMRDENLQSCRVLIASIEEAVQKGEVTDANPN